VTGCYSYNVYNVIFVTHTMCTIAHTMCFIWLNIYFYLIWHPLCGKQWMSPWFSSVGNTVYAWMNKMSATYVPSCILWLQHCCDMMNVSRIQQMSSFVLVWENLLALCWCLHHYSNWCRYTTNSSEFIICKMTVSPKDRTWKARLDLCAVWTKS